MDAGRRVITDGAVAIDTGEIVAVGPAAEVARGLRGATSRSTRGGGIVIPGLVNTHTHAPMVLFRGIADDLRLMDWLQKFIFPAEKKNVTAAFVTAGTRLAALEMIRSGTTTFADMYYFEDQVAEAAKEAGLRVVAGETLIEFPAPGQRDDDRTRSPTPSAFLARWKGDPLVTAAVAPHSTYLTSPETPGALARAGRPVRRAAAHPPLRVGGRAAPGARALRQDADRAPARPRLPAQGRASARTACGSRRATARS